MKNPWLQKNPFMSMWLSGANRMLGTARGHATGEAHRHAARMMAAQREQIARFWTGAMWNPPAKKRRKSR